MNWILALGVGAVAGTTFGMLIGGWCASSGMADERTHYIRIIDDLIDRLKAKRADEMITDGY